MVDSPPMTAMFCGGQVKPYVSLQAQQAPGVRNGFSLL